MRTYIITENDGKYKVEFWSLDKALPANAVYSAASADEIMEVFINDFQDQNF